MRLLLSAVACSPTLGSEAHFGWNALLATALSTWRVACPLWKLPIPFIWGPLGGGEEFPPHLYSLLSPSSRWYERLRRAQTAIALRSPSVRQCARKSTLLLASNPDTANLLKKLTHPLPARIHTLSAATFLPEQLSRFPLPPPTRPPLANRQIAGDQTFSKKCHRLLEEVVGELQETKKKSRKIKVSNGSD